ncbi:MAG: hypothetical protein LBI82_04150 [Dysgonamonadaceae bacterium]|jgi:lipid II:glycine glycyltransferase (peptidoglycan interpeptide bridge formation enzyme)|nr:hypothetical protein [Dysgonamonadaceae bacterium]
MIYYLKNRFLHTAEIWYNSAERPINKVDRLCYQYVEKKSKKMFFLRELFTILLDLSKSENELFSEIKKNTKYEINRAKNKDNVICGNLLEIGYVDNSSIDKFVDFYNDFAQSKKRGKINVSDLQQFINMKNFCIRYVQKDDEIIAMHSYVVSDNIARLFHSCSLFRKNDDSEYRSMVGRANRLLHWDDILYFKNGGLSTYDLGGWCGDQTNAEQLLINQFKESFGGKKKKEYSYIIPVSFLGLISVINIVLRQLIQKKQKSNASN